jgi:ribonuclease D
VVRKLYALRLSKARQINNNQGKIMKIKKYKKFARVYLRSLISISNLAYFYKKKEYYLIKGKYIKGV